MVPPEAMVVVEEGVETAPKPVIIVEERAEAFLKTGRAHKVAEPLVCFHVLILIFGAPEAMVAVEETAAKGLLKARV